MIHTDLLETLRADRKRGPFQYPYYGKYSISEIPPTILSLFGIPTPRATLPFPLMRAKPYKKVLFMFIDGFGFDHFISHAKMPFFKELAERGDVYPITSTFPSTTPAALTSLHTDRTPQEHGLPEWTVYFEELGQIIEPFLFRPHMNGEREALLSQGGDPKMLYDGSTIYDELAAGGVTSYIVTKEEYIHTSYSKMSQHGAVPVPYTEPSDFFSKTAELVNTAKEPAYIFSYWGQVDGIEHAFGPGSPEHEKSLTELSDFLSNDFLKKISPEAAEDTLIILSSDHGQTPIKNEEIIYLDEYIEIKDNYRMTAAHHAIYPTGSPHDVFLHLAPEKVEETARYLREKLAGKAEVRTTEEALKDGLFGLYEPSARFRARLGDLIILPYDGYHIWFRHVPDFVFRQRGIHGGLSEREMIVPFAAAPLSALISNPAT